MMKIAIFGESTADEDATAILVSGILGADIERPHLPSLRTRGWSQMLAELPRIIRALHFNSDADGLVVIADSNGHSLHGPEHEEAPKSDADCRFCAIREVAQCELARLKARPVLPPLRVAVGLAVPALEAWLLSQRRTGLTEAMVKVARQERRELHSRAQLKELLYGTSRPTLELETAKMVEHMREIVRDLQRLRTAFPGGFGPLYDEIMTWK